MIHKSPVESALDYERLQQGCESEQLHLSGAVQSYGAVVRMELKTKLITHVSKNITEFIGGEAESILGCDVSVISEELSLFIERLPVFVGKKHIYPYAVYLNSIPINFIVYFDEDCGVLIELEKQTPFVLDIKKIHSLQNDFGLAPNSKYELQLKSQLLVDAIKLITGYDRVMFYRFLDDWSGEVIAEATNDNIGSYLGLRFPAADIPLIARNLYMLNLSRPIPDIKSAPVEIVSKDAGMLNLTYSELRSVSPVHLQYLENMGVGASISFAIKSIDKLYGLIACHNMEPKSTPLDVRNHCVTLVQSYSLGVSYFRMQSKMQALDSLSCKIEKLIESISKYENKMDGFEYSAESLLELFDARGLLFVIDNNISQIGVVPTTDFILELDNYFLSECKDNIFLSDNLCSTVVCSEENMRSSSGVLAIKYNSAKSGLVRFYWFRPEIQTEITWAGNPDKPAVEDPNAIALSPRRSFEKYVEIKKGFSRSWSSAEKLAATNFRQFLLLWM